MAPRAYWKGFLKLSLVSCPIALYPATTFAEKTHFHQINKRTGNRLRQQMVDAETGSTVDKENKGRAYEISKGRYVEIGDDELDAVQVESTHTIDIDEFQGEKVKKISKAEAILRGVVVGALRGDTRSLAMLLRMVEQAGGFEDPRSEITGIQRVIVRWEDLNKASDG